MSRARAKSQPTIADLPPGTILRAVYRIESRVGGGGMAVVYRASDLRSAGVWAVKEMRPQAVSAVDLSEAKALFEREATLLNRLTHPNLPKVIERFDEGGRTYLVMEFIDGQTLEELQSASAGMLDEATVLSWMTQVCDALAYLHGQSPPIIFRDLKPGNIMLSRSGVVKLIDFGIARHFAPGKTKDTKLLGTPGYAPPEQYGKGQTFAYSDVYALGATMYHLLTNTAPPLSTLPLPLVSPRALNPTLTPGVEQVILRAMQKEPKDRYQTAKEFADALQGLLAPASTPAAAATPTPDLLCQNCSRLNRAQARFCGHCGAPLTGALLASLQILGASCVAWEMPITRSPFLIGRLDQPQHSPDLDLSSQDGQFISRSHAQIVRTGHNYFLTDLGSANGTFVNGGQLSPQVPHSLRSGDQIRIGSVRLLFKLNALC